MYTINHEGTAFSIQKQSDLQDVPTAALVNEFNELSGKSIKKFENREKAVDRVWELISEIAKAPKDQPNKREVGVSVKINKDAEIRIIETTNPKRPNSSAYARYEKYRNGMKVEDYLTKHGGQLADIRWDTGKGFIELVEKED